MRWLLLLAVAVLLAGCGSSGRYSVSEVKQAFAKVGLRHPRVDRASPGPIFNYGTTPHLVSVTVFAGKILKPVYLGGHIPKGKHLAYRKNVAVFYDQAETPIVTRALNLLK